MSHQDVTSGNSSFPFLPRPMELLWGKNMSWKDTLNFQSPFFYFRIVSFREGIANGTVLIPIHKFYVIKKPTVSVDSQRQLQSHQNQETCALPVFSYSAMNPWQLRTGQPRMARGSQWVYSQICWKMNPFQPTKPKEASAFFGSFPLVQSWEMHHFEDEV